MSMSFENGTVVVPIEELAGADAEETAQVLLAAGFAPTIIYPPGVTVAGRKTPESALSACENGMSPKVSVMYE